MADKKDHSDEILWVYPPRKESESWWCRQYGNIEIPVSWESILPGDPFVTRQVKTVGPHSVAVKPAKGYTKTLGIWAPKENIEAALKLAVDKFLVKHRRRRQGRETAKTRVLRKACPEPDSGWKEKMMKPVPATGRDSKCECRNNFK